MATLVLQTVGSVIGSFVGGPVGSAIGSAIGATAGSVIDQSMAQSRSGGGRKITRGPRLKDLDGITATEGAAIPRLYGRARLGGQIIWATRIEEEPVYSSTKPRGGKGGIGGGASKGKASVDISYRYYANVAIGLCEGSIAFVRRVWADGKPIDLTTITMRVHRGENTQSADPLIIAKQGVNGAPAYRGLAYVVFERLDLGPYGNRLPQFTFEVVRPVHGLCNRIQAINIIPGAGEYAYEPASMSLQKRLGASVLPNRTQLTHVTDWHASLDALQALCPNLENVALVISWFGNDLRAGHCTLRPLTEPGSVDGYPFVWSVAGLTRATAGTVSAPDGKPSFGGTPSDGSVMRAIRDLKARGLKVTLYPFVMMDIPATNSLPNPWTATLGQPAYPWRGRITCYPAPGRVGTVEGSLAAETQLSVFIGSCQASQFSTGVDTLAYNGPAEWTLRRLVLHTAALGKAAGGVDAIVLASEMISLTHVRGTGAINPAVAGLKALASEVRSLLGSQTKITYGADWTEYGAEVRSGGSDVQFPLDPLWADPNIDAVAIDWYPPTTDWRDGLSHLDAAVYDGPLDQKMFQDRIDSGEAFDWYYRDDAARVAQTRLPITDGAYNKTWIFRPKDLVGWWSNPHKARNGGIEQTTSTAWVPGSKPIWLLELGCPAVDRGGNGPNVFPDQKSSEAAVPFFSRGMRDDCVQARYLTAALDHFLPQALGFQNSANPSSSLFQGRMVEPSRVYLWAFDARPFPAFPAYADLWSDADNYNTGHWLNGRLEGAPVDDVLAAMLADYGLLPPDVIHADGFVEGYVIDQPLSLRGVIEPLADLFAFDAMVSAGKLRFVRRSSAVTSLLPLDALAVSDERDRPLKSRAQASELPCALTLAFTDVEADFRQAVVRVAVADDASNREVAAEFAVGLRRSEASYRAEVMLNEARAARETVELTLPPSRIDLEPGDSVVVGSQTYRIRRITDGAIRTVAAVAIEPTLYLGAPRSTPNRRQRTVVMGGLPLLKVIDLPATGVGTEVLQGLAVTSQAWPGAYTLWRSDDGTSYSPIERISTSATVGETITPLNPGPIWRFDRFNSVDVDLSHGVLQSVSEVAVLNGANLFAAGSTALGWEIIGFTTATLLAANKWRLSGLLRGLSGSEMMASIAKPVGTSLVILDGAIVDLAAGTEFLNRQIKYRLSPEGRDHADPLAVSFQATAGSSALLPLSPRRLSARREIAGVRLSWLRRTRSGGDNWEVSEVPLGEENEAYSVEILNGSISKRLMYSNVPSVLYPIADESADFGVTQTHLRFRVRQTSLAVGSGHQAEALVRIR
jgi:GTA TIM-barrel-like domain/Putative phage tail protein/Glycine zipper